MVASSSSRASTRRPRMRIAVLVAVMTGSPPRRGRSAAATPPRWSRLTPRNRSRSSSGAVKPRWRIWLSDLILVDRADRFATTRARMASTLPSRVLPAPWALPDSAARAASTASAGSDLPVRRRDWRFGRSTSTTATPAARSDRARLAPYEPVPSTPTWAMSPKDRSHTRSLSLPAPDVSKLSTPNRPPMPSNAAATCTSRWVSTPPVTAHTDTGSTMVIAIPSVSLVKGWHAPPVGCGAGAIVLLAQGDPPHSKEERVPIATARGRWPTDRSQDSRQGVSRFWSQARPNRETYNRTTQHRWTLVPVHTLDTPCRIGTAGTRAVHRLIGLLAATEPRLVRV